jgi:hypothetical protein
LGITLFYDTSGMRYIGVEVLIHGCCVCRVKNRNNSVNDIGFNILLGRGGLRWIILSGHSVR